MIYLFSQQSYSFRFEQIEKNEYEEKICCWTCITCKPSEIILNETDCHPCAEGFWPNANKSSEYSSTQFPIHNHLFNLMLLGCVDVPISYIQWTTSQLYTAKSLSVVGMILTSFTIYVFVKHRNTPVVKSTTRELCYVILIGLLIHHSTIFISVAEPSIISCALIRIAPPVSAAMVYASLLVKTNRIARLLTISKRKFPNLSPRFMTLKAQVRLT